MTLQIGTRLGPYEVTARIASRYLRRERVGHTLQPTALVHEAYVKLIDQDRARWQWLLANLGRASKT